MSKHPVLLEISGRIATVTLNDPERRNPVTGNDMIAALLETFAKVQADPQVSVMILTGADHQGNERSRQRVPQGAAGGGAELC